MLTDLGQTLLSQLASRLPSWWLNQPVQSIGNPFLYPSQHVALSCPSRSATVQAQLRCTRQGRLPRMPVSRPHAFWPEKASTS